MKAHPERRGFLPLILIILILYASALPPDASEIETGCTSPLFLEVAGETGKPVVYACRDREEVLSLMSRTGVPVEDSGRTIRSGTRVTVRSKRGRNDIFLGEMSAFYKVTLGIPISLNRESEEGLTAVPGIGPHLAGDIILERAKRGGFARLDEMTSIPGIGQRLYERLRPYFTL